MEHWRCSEVDQRKRQDRLRSKIEGRQILPGMSYSLVVSYAAISCDHFKEPKFQYLTHTPE